MVEDPDWSSTEPAIGSKTTRSGLQVEFNSKPPRPLRITPILVLNFLPLALFGHSSRPLYSIMLIEKAVLTTNQ